MAYGSDDGPELCATCYSDLEPGAQFCPNCGTAPRTPARRRNRCRCAHCVAYDARTPARRRIPGLPEAAAPADVPNYLVWAILATLCCLPTGIVAIVYAVQVNSKSAYGDYHGALDASYKAKTWCWVSLGLGIIPTLFIIFIIL